MFSSVIKNMGSTLAACGDVNRNVLASPAPYKNRPEYQYATQYANDIADLLAPQSGAYYDVWLDGEKFFSHEMEVKTWQHAADLSRLAAVQSHAGHTQSCTCAVTCLLYDLGPVCLPQSLIRTEEKILSVMRVAT